MKLKPICFILGLGIAASNAFAYQIPSIGGAYGQTVRFHLSAGNFGCFALVRMTIGDLLPAAEKRFSLRSGESGFLDVNLNGFTDRYRRRADLLPSVRNVEGDCQAGMELFDNVSGRVVTSLPIGDLGKYLLEDQAAQPVLPPVTATSGQIVRLGVTRGFDPQPEPPACRVTLGFVDASGAAVGPSKTVNLAAGASDAVELDAGLLLPASGLPLQTQRFVRPRLLLPASIGGTARGCAVSVQVFESATGATTQVHGLAR